MDRLVCEEDVLKEGFLRKIGGIYEKSDLRFRFIICPNCTRFCKVTNPIVNDKIEFECQWCGVFNEVKL
jgi:hypothetical protein